jgi:hypothetical protein
MPFTAVIKYTVYYAEPIDFLRLISKNTSALVFFSFGAFMQLIHALSSLLKVLVQFSFTCMS